MIPELTKRLAAESCASQIRGPGHFAFCHVNCAERFAGGHVFDVGEEVLCVDGGQLVKFLRSRLAFTSGLASCRNAASLHREELGGEAGQQGLVPQVAERLRRPLHTYMFQGCQDNVTPPTRPDFRGGSLYKLRYKKRMPAA
jgi:hypothetical protein